MSDLPSQPKNEPSVRFNEELSQNNLTVESLKELLDFDIETTLYLEPDDEKLHFLKGSRFRAAQIDDKNFIKEETRRLHVHPKYLKYPQPSIEDYYMSNRKVPEIVVNRDGIDIITYPKRNPMDKNMSFRELEQTNDRDNIFSMYIDSRGKYALQEKFHSSAGRLSPEDNAEYNQLMVDFGIDTGGLLKRIPWDHADIQVVLDFMNGKISNETFCEVLNIKVTD